MATRERPADRGVRAGTRAVQQIGVELRLARVAAGLSVDAVAAVASISNAQISRIERGLSPRVPATTLIRLGSVVGLDVSIRAYPGGDPLRDAAQHALMVAFGSRLHATLRWATEVPLPIAGDRRAWDGLVAGGGWRYGVEAETQPSDEQALLRRLALKERDGQVDGVLLVVPDSRRARRFVGAASHLRAAFPVRGAVALDRLRRGEDPGGSAVIVLPRLPRHTPDV